MVSEFHAVEFDDDVSAVVACNIWRTLPRGQRRNIAPCRRDSPPRYRVLHRSAPRSPAVIARHSCGQRQPCSVRQYQCRRRSPAQVSVGEVARYTTALYPCSLSQPPLIEKLLPASQPYRNGLFVSVSVGRACDKRIGRQQEA